MKISLRRIALFVCGMASWLAPAAAQSGLPAALKDIALAPVPSYSPLLANPQVFVHLGDELVFAAWEPTTGLELRVWQPSSAVRTVRDVCPGSCHGFFIFDLVVSDGIAYFVGNDGVHGSELWRTDGSAAGTAMVADIVPGLDRGAFPQHLTPVPGGLYFVADDGVHGQELWFSNGTAAGTHLVADLLPGPPDDSQLGPSHLVWLPGKGLVFSAEDGVHGREPWLTQGTAATTVSLGDILPGAGSGMDSYQPFPGKTPDVGLAGGRVFFPADDGVHGFELWATDGTAAGTSLVMDTVPGAGGGHPRRFHDAGSTVLFGAGDTISSTTLWRSDGTPAGTYPLGDAAHGSEQLRPTVYADWGPWVYFVGYQPATGRELWKTDGTLAGTQLAKDVLPGPASGVQTSDYLFQGADIFWFPGTNGVDGVEWWMHNPSFTIPVGDMMPGPASSVDPVYAVTHPAVIGEPGFQHVVFGSYEVSRGWTLWSSRQGSTPPDVLYSPAEHPGSVPLCSLWNCPPRFVPWSGGVAFGAMDGPHGMEPWTTDGIETDTRLLTDLAPGDRSGFSPVVSFHNAAGWEDGLLVVGSDCVSQSCPAGSVQVFRVDAAGNALRLTNESWTLGPGELTVWNGAGFFAGDDALWKTDGSVAGTAPLAGPGGAHGFTPGASRLYFVAGGLWKTDGTAAGTIAVAAALSLTVQSLVLASDAGGNDILYFAAADAAGGNELWTSDGTDAGTRRVVDLAPGAASGMPTPHPPGFDDPGLVAALGSRALFVAADGVTGEELWISDGQPGNASLLEVRPGGAGSEPRALTTVGNRVYFVADDGVHGREPWVTDGTVAGTHLVADVNPGPSSSTPHELTAWMGRLVFAADDGVHGAELWRSTADGDGAALVLEISPGVEPASPQGLSAVGERLYFFASDGWSGLEPWVWSAAADMFKDGFETGNVVRWSRVTPP